MEIEFKERAIVITPTIGSKHLRQCTQSVLDQTYPFVDHLVVVDGAEHFHNTLNNISISDDRGPIVQAMHFNVGSDQGMKFYGHRIYAGFSHMIPFKYKYIFLLDEDNWFDPEHVESCVKEMQKGQYQFVSTLRKIYSKDGNYLIDDDCESIGTHPVYFKDGNGQDHYHVDTSSYCFSNEFFRFFGQHWAWGWGADRRFFDIVRNFMKQNNAFHVYGSTGKHTLCYRLEGNENSVDIGFFQNGNARMKEQYGEIYPWRKSDA